MASRHTLFRVFYGLGFTPWDGHAQVASLLHLIKGTADTPALPPGSALDVGCGTGDSSIYLAQHGWQVTGVDFVAKPLDKARAKARAAGVSVNFVQADVTHLSRAGVGGDFGLRLMQKLACRGDVGLAVGVGEQPIVADAVKAGRQHV